MLPFDAYVHSELRRLQGETFSKDSRHREQWLRWQEEERIARRRALLRWTGDHLVSAGEALRAWSERYGAAQDHQGNPPQPACPEGQS